MSIQPSPSPDRIMQLISGGWSTAILGSAARHGIFNALDGDGGDARNVAARCGISERGAQAELDGLTGLGLLTFSNGKYRNTAESAAFLVKGKPAYFGGMAEVMTGSLTDWATLPEAVRTGNPTAASTAEMADNEFWHLLVPAIAAMSQPTAQMVADKLGIAKAGAVRWLDVGGGSGIWSAVWLTANPQGTGVQLDWPKVNSIAKDFVGKFSASGNFPVSNFQTIDGDFHTVDFGSGKYDFAIYGHIAHQESPDSNVAIFRKFRKALKPGGTLVINDFVLNDDRMGHPFAMMFASQMLLVSGGGNAWTQAHYRSWLTEAGFTSISFVATPSPATIVLAQ